MRDILWGYVLGICRRYMLWAYVVDIRCGDTLQVYVVDIRCRYTLVASEYGYVVGIRCRHMLRAYVGCIGRGCTAVRVMSVGVVYRGVSLGVGWCQEHKSVPMTNLGLSLSYLVVMYVYIIAHFTTQFQPA